MVGLEAAKRHHAVPARTTRELRGRGAEGDGGVRGRSVRLRAQLPGSHGGAEEGGALLKRPVRGQGAHVLAGDDQAGRISPEPCHLYAR